MLYSEYVMYRNGYNLQRYDVYELQHSIDDHGNESTNKILVDDYLTFDEASALIEESCKDALS